MQPASLPERALYNAEVDDSHRCIAGLAASHCLVTVCKLVGGWEIVFNSSASILMFVTQCCACHDIAVFAVTHSGVQKAQNDSARSVVWGGSVLTL